MKLGILTSSRADFGIYTSLIGALKKDDFFKLEIIAFGTHLSHDYGYTITEIQSLGLNEIHEISTPVLGNTPKELSQSMGETVKLFSSFWANHTYDFVLVLGDRFEMFAAVSAASPFLVKFAHLHAGETTLGAIDNSYRHSISLFSKILFTSTDQYKIRALEISNQTSMVYNVGALSIDNLRRTKLYSKDEFFNKFKIDLNKKTILSTFHPETVSYQHNVKYIETVLNVFLKLQEKFQIVLTMPNMDTMGKAIRSFILKFQNKHRCLIIVESFGMKGYLSCMKHCSFMLGNTSSGFVEASFFPTKVINIGNRQQGRLMTENIVNCEIEYESIMSAVEHIQTLIPPKDITVYGKGDTSNKIIKILKESTKWA